ncbi:hypothetical protein [Streptomyces candidus]|uniref:Uncharacterized protein n=1 Tax=Streptomyces candidus TaxID=67283 RepID=A0A7X0HK27_9ACTN|nr:hypothetical protein [Streptomyces candidus]MBB6439112.1 hypothetical protein [Streptomyces candidus]
MAQQYGDHPSEWHRLVLYALTDALAYNFLMVGVLVGYLQEQEVDADLLCRHAQSPDPDRYVTPKALDLLAGLMGRPVNEGEQETTWQFIGRQIAECGVDRSGGDELAARG